MAVCILSTLCTHLECTTNHALDSRSTSFTYFTHDAVGDANFEFFKKVITFHPISQTLNACEWNISTESGHFALALFTFLYVDIIDCTATLYSMARFAGVVDPETGDFPRSTIAYCTDAMTISIGALMGLSPCTAFIESGAGIAEGGKTGLTAIVTGTCFLISIFFAPIFASVPPWATGGTLILVCVSLSFALSLYFHNALVHTYRPSSILTTFDAKGRNAHDAPNNSRKLEISRRCPTRFHHTGINAPNIFRRLWLNRVRLFFPS